MRLVPKGEIIQYKLKEDARFVCGTTSFGLSSGAVVQVNQTDASTGQVLIDFGGGLVDWFDESVLAKRFEAV